MNGIKYAEVISRTSSDQYVGGDYLSLLQCVGGIASHQKSTFHNVYFLAVLPLHSLSVVVSLFRRALSLLLSLLSKIYMNNRCKAHSRVSYTQ